MKKTLLVFTAACFFALSSQAQYASMWAGYPSGYQLSAGFATQATPGYFWLGYLPNVLPVNTLWHSNKNFCIMGSGASSIWASYKVFESSACNGGYSQVLSGNGVSAIETSGTNGQTYALAGVYNKACYFTMLDKSGNVLTAVSYPFPFLPVSRIAPTKPLIIESNVPGEYYICGYFESDMYVLNVRANGSVIWSSFYSVENDLMPKDMMINPYEKEQLLIVGETSIAPGDNEGFLISLDRTSGAVIGARQYGSPNGGMDGFATIIEGSALGTNVNPPIGHGLVIGGYTDKLSGNPGSAPWALRLDAAGNVLWTNILNPSLGSNNGIIDIVERLNTLGTYEYYALVDSDMGMQVLKLDDKLMPFPLSSPRALYNEFIYDLPAPVSSKANSISYINSQAPTVDVGIQVFGTANNFPGFSSSYVVSAYFNGETNCYRALTRMNVEDDGVVNVTNLSVKKYGALSACANFFVLAYFPGGALNYPCLGSVPGGSNQRSMPAGIDPQLAQAANEHFNVYPNPVVDKALVNYSVSDNSQVSITLYNILGQQIVSIQPETGLAGTYQQEIDFNALNIEHGVYFVATTVDGEVHKQKVVYGK